MNNFKFKKYNNYIILKMINIFNYITYLNNKYEYDINSVLKKFNIPSKSKVLNYLYFEHHKNGDKYHIPFNITKMYNINNIFIYNEWCEYIHENIIDEILNININNIDYIKDKYHLHLNINDDVYKLFIFLEDNLDEFVCICDIPKKYIMTNIKNIKNDCNNMYNNYIKSIINDIKNKELEWINNMNIKYNNIY